MLKRKSKKVKMTFLVSQTAFKRSEIIAESYFDAKRLAIENFQTGEPDWKGEIFTELEKIEQLEK